MGTFFSSWPFGLSPVVWNQMCCKAPVLQTFLHNEGIFGWQVLEWLFLPCGGGDRTPELHTMWNRQLLEDHLAALVPTCFIHRLPKHNRLLRWASKASVCRAASALSVDKSFLRELRAGGVEQSTKVQFDVSLHLQFLLRDCVCFSLTPARLSIWAPANLCCSGICAELLLEGPNPQIRDWKREERHLHGTVVKIWFKYGFS